MPTKGLRSFIRTCTCFFFFFNGMCTVYRPPKVDSLFVIAEHQIFNRAIGKECLSFEFGNIRFGLEFTKKDIFEDCLALPLDLEAQKRVKVLNAACSTSVCTDGKVGKPAETQKST